MTNPEIESTGGREGNATPTHTSAIGPTTLVLQNNTSQGTAFKTGSSGAIQDSNSSKTVAPKAS